MTAFFPSGYLIRDFVLSIPYGGKDGAPAEAGVEVLFFSGFALDRGTVIDSATLLSQWLSQQRQGEADLSLLCGSFSAVIRNGATVSLWNDLFGMISLFYWRGRGHTIVSNRLHLVSREMRRLGVPVVPAYGVIAASLSSTNVFFQQAFSHRTLIADVWLVPVDEHIVLGRRSFETRKKPAMSRLPGSPQAVPTKRGYDDLLAAAAADLVANVRGLVTHDGFRGAYCDLSGGIDSRVVFAALLEAGLLDRVGIRTFQSSTPQDLEIGCGITQLYGARFHAGNDRMRFSKRTEFCLSLWRSMKAGSHHRIAFSNWPSLPHARPALHLSGASGEVFRRFWLDACFPRQRARSDEPGFLPSLFARACRPHLAQPFRAEAEQVFVEALTQMPGDDPAERFENHYMFFRNRFHFGMTPYNLWFGYLDTAVLNTPSLLQAWSALPIDERREGRLLFDLTERMAPQLNRLPYAKEFQWPEAMLGRPADPPAGLAALPVEQGLTAWHDAARNEARLRSAHQVLADPIHDKADLVTAAVDAALQDLGSLRDDQRLGAFLDGRFEEWFRSQVAESPRHAAETASKIMAVFDLCFDESDDFVSIGDLPQAEIYLPGHTNAVSTFGAEIFA